MVHLKTKRNILAFLSLGLALTNITMFVIGVTSHDKGTQLFFAKVLAITTIVFVVVYQGFIRSSLKIIRIYGPDHLKTR